MTSKQSKRIESVTIRRIFDETPDTSYLGEYSNSAKSEYSIDRAHALDCASVTPQPGIDELGRIMRHLYDQRNVLTNATEDVPKFETLDSALDLLSELQDSLTECDCNESGDMGRGEYRYFNPNHENYKGCTPEEIRTYCQQDYARSESLNRGNWSYIGVKAVAEIRIGELRQEISSGGLWGIESDSEESYFRSVAADELSDLRDQLYNLGFSKRAIATACKDVTTSGDAA